MKEQERSKGYRNPSCVEHFEIRERIVEILEAKVKKFEAIKTKAEGIAYPMSTYVRHLC
jgi:hypothetical protein